MRRFLLLASLLMLAYSACAPTDAPTPSEPMPTPTPSAPTPTPEPGTIKLGPRLQHIDPKLWVLMYQHAAGEEVPKGVAIWIGADPDIETDVTLDDFLEGFNFWETEDALCIPTQHLAALAQRPDILTIEDAYGPSDSRIDPDVESRMWGDLDEAVSALEGGGVEDKTVCGPSKRPSPAR